MRAVDKTLRKTRLVVAQAHAEARRDGMLAQQRNLQALLDEIDGHLNFIRKPTPQQVLLGRSF